MSDPLHFQIVPLHLSELHSFWLVFKDVLETDFPGYSKETVRTFLEKLYTEYAFDFYLKNNQKSILIAKANNQIVGFAVIDEPYGGVSLLRWLGVQKDFQKKGIGKALINGWLELARRQGSHKAELAAQPLAKEFYEKAGLEQEGLRKKSYFGIDQYIFGKILI